MKFKTLCLLLFNSMHLNTISQVAKLNSVCIFIH